MARRINVGVTVWWYTFCDRERDLRRVSEASAATIELAVRTVAVVTERAVVLESKTKFRAAAVAAKSDVVTEMATTWSAVPL